MTPIPDNELSALISLIDEPDPGNYFTIRNRIISFGTTAIPMLENTWEHSLNATIQQRIESLIHLIQYDDVSSSLKQWARHEDHDLLKGLYIVSRYQYPELSLTSVEKQLYELVQSAWLEINDNLTALEKIGAINQVLFDLHKFSGNTVNIHSPQNYYINTLLETKKGSPVSLSALYILVARALNLPVYGVNLPQHFILGYASEEYFLEPHSFTSSDILFYINPFNRGSVFTKDLIDNFLKEKKLEYDDAYYLPCDNRTIIRRILGNLAFSYESTGNPEKKEEIDQLLALLG